MSIVFTGGGTAGSLTSLLTIAHKIRTRNSSALLHFIAPKGSIGKKIVTRAHVRWHEIHAAKLDRYFSLNNFLIPFRLVIAYIEAYRLLMHVDAQVVVTSGSFVSPPVFLAARTLGIKTVLIQLDSTPGLANKLMRPFACKIFLSWKHLTRAFPNGEYVGLPLPDIKTLPKLPFTIPPGKKLLTIVGGGTGAKALNELVWESLDELVPHAYIVHITGGGKKNYTIHHEHYRQFSFIDSEWYHTLISVSDLIISRAGMGAIADFILHGSPVILIPYPHSHQEKNASLLENLGAAAVFNQKNLSPLLFAKYVRSVLFDDTKKRLRRKKMRAIEQPDAAERIALYICTIV